MSGIIVSQKRPRNLAWYHAGPLLYGDWGTSRLYVLGLAFAFTGFASPVYLVALSVLMVAVAWAYTIICRSFPDGGGVYSAARQIHPLVGVVGGTLLLADYIVTSALSLADATHYLGLPEGPGKWWLFMYCALAVAVLAGINWFGSRSAGRFALVIALAAMVFSVVIALACLPFLGEGVRSIHWAPAPPFTRWMHFTSIILALSGVEAVANMTGLMKEPVPRTVRRTIWPVLGEVAAFNILFGVILMGVLAAKGAIDSFQFSDEEVKNAAMRVLAVEGGQHWFGEGVGAIFGRVAGVVFALLLVSAANTVMVGKIAVIYTLGRDGELPKRFTRLNYSGVPWLPWLIAAAAPVLLLAFVRDLEALAHLYAIGVCGAIALNLICCAINKRIKVSRTQRAGLWAVGGVVTAVWITIAITKPQAAAFAGGLVLAALIARAAARAAQRRPQLPEPAAGWLAEVQRQPLAVDSSKPRIMLAARGQDQAEFAVTLARKRGAILFAMYVRTLRVMDVQPGSIPQIADDPDAQQALGTIAVLCREAGVPFVPIYITSPNITEEILDYTVTYGCDTLIMGATRRGPLSRRFTGDVVGRVQAHLPEGIDLIIRAARSAPSPAMEHPAAPVHVDESEPPPT